MSVSDIQFQLTYDPIVVLNDYLSAFDRLRLVSLVGKVPVYRARGSGSIPDRINTQGLKIIEEKVLPLL